MKRVCWFGIYEGEKLIENFPCDPLQLSEIFDKIESGEIKGEEYGKREPPEGLNYEVLREAAIFHAKRKLRRIRKEDADIIEAVRFYDELTETINIYFMRIKSWSNQSISEEIFTNSERKKKIEDISRIIDELYAEKRDIEKYIDNKMKEIAPNIREICGSIIGAKLISLAGGIEKLAFMPASTIQVLGAEKALFSHIRRGTKPPKHGILYQHPLIQNSPKKARGKIARSMAAKIAIAARLDLNSKPIESKLKEDLMNRINNILKSI